MTSSLLINEPPLQVLPSLAKLIGLNEAIILQQVHYWLVRSKNVRDGKTWVYKTYAEWKEEFPFWSEDTIYRTIRKLEAMVLLESTDEYNAMPTDRTKWYTIDYAYLEILRTTQDAEVEHRKTRKSTDTQDAEVLPKTTAKTTKPKKKKESATPPPPAVSAFHEVVERYPRKQLFERIANAIGESPEALEKWKAHIIDWMGHDWNPMNITGLLETWAKGGIAPRATGQTTNAKRQQPYTPPTEADLEAMAQQNAEYEAYAAAQNTPPQPATASPALHTFASGKTPAQVWQGALETLRGQLQQATFDTWLGGSRYHGFEGGVLIIQVQSENARQWLEKRLNTKVARALELWAGETVEVRYIVNGE